MTGYSVSHNGLNTRNFKIITINLLYTFERLSKLVRIKS